MLHIVFFVKKFQCIRLYCTRVGRNIFFEWQNFNAGGWGCAACPQAKEFDAVVVDQVATPLFFLRVFNHQALFYCHFPDKLCDATLTQPNRSLLRRAYRLVFDCLEEWCAPSVSHSPKKSVFCKTGKSKAGQTI